jgi:hypothetical protein
MERQERHRTLEHDGADAIKPCHAPEKYCRGKWIKHLH